ncbi:MAG: hypothetical protein C4547_07815 [Phycisphaerales bacterium]|nr:MAG: hypothetical protein C4547_07815 [Phycisphaerales bacterium]
MISVHYDPNLIEQTVRLAVRRDAAAEIELHRAIDPIFELPDGDERENRFRQAFVEWFKKLRLDRFVDEALANFPRVVEQVERGVVRTAPRRKSQGAELFVSREAGGACRTLLIQVCPESLIDGARTHDLLLRELQHVEDMLDESFAYVPESLDGPASRQQLTRDRYAVLWDIRVESTLARRGLLTDTREKHLRERLAMAFTVGGQAPPEETFERVWEAPSLGHACLMSWAKDPPEWMVSRAATGGAVGGRPPGATCPICGFPTFDWYEPSGEEESLVASWVRASRPSWTAGDGICRQCAEHCLSREAQRSCV